METTICIILGFLLLALGSLLYLAVDESKRAKEREKKLKDIIERNMKHDRGSKG